MNSKTEREYWFLFIYVADLACFTAGADFGIGISLARRPHDLGGFIPGKKTAGNRQFHSRSDLGLGSFGALVGILTGVVGLGGGYALVPSFIYLFGAPVYITMGTSLDIIR